MLLLQFARPKNHVELRITKYILYLGKQKVLNEQVQEFCARKALSPYEVMCKLSTKFQPIYTCITIKYRKVQI